MEKEDELFEAKRELYHLLLCKQKDKLTEREINIMFELSLDEDIQKFLDKRLGRK